MFGAVISGVGFGLIFKSGFTTGGTDILNQIVSEKAKVSIGKSMIFTDGVIIVSSLFVFGWQKFIYSIINIGLNNFRVDPNPGHLVAMCSNLNMYSNQRYLII